MRKIFLNYQRKAVILKPKGVRPDLSFWFIFAPWLKRMCADLKHLFISARCNGVAQLNDSHGAFIP